MFLFRKQSKKLNNTNNTNNTNINSIYFGMKIRQRDIMDYVKINTLRNKNKWHKNFCINRTS